MTDEPRKQPPPTTATGAYARAFGWFGNRRKRRQEALDREHALDDEARDLHAKLEAMKAEFERIKRQQLPEGGRGDHRA